MAKYSPDSARKLARKYEVTASKGFRLHDVDPADTGGIRSHTEVKDALTRGIEELAGMQEMLYAQNRWALLLIFQAMDAGGKDGTIKHVMSGVNPQGCQVYSFKAPSVEELDHDFLWRTSRRLPERGRIGIFNRSYYEEVLIVRVHPEVLGRERIPDSLVTGRIWDERFEDIRASERYLSRNGIAVRKFFLHVSPQEQKARFLKRLEEPEKNWKFALPDVQERAFFKDYMHAYEQMVRNTATPWAPWYVVPADHKWFAHFIVVGAILEALSGLDLAFPKVDEEKKKGLQAARKILRREGGGS
jgi:PPK2 family polyphosphate:nucleotide phosphotransferase